MAGLSWGSIYITFSAFSQKLYNIRQRGGGMKIATGRGIKFFKHPVFTVPKSFAVKTFNDSKRHLNTLIKKKGGNK